MGTVPVATRFLIPARCEASGSAPIADSKRRTASEEGCGREDSCRCKNSSGRESGISPDESGIEKTGFSAPPRSNVTDSTIIPPPCAP